MREIRSKKFETMKKSSLAPFLVLAINLHLDLNFVEGT
jgi:hypothetical protein